MAVICRDERLLFVMAPRTGCTTIGELLRSELGGEDMPPPSAAGDPGYPIYPKHVTLKELLEHGFLTPEERRALFVFSAVRNPFDSLVSLYVKQSTVYAELLDDPDSWVNRTRGMQASIRFARDHSFDEWLIERYERSRRRRLSRFLRRFRGDKNRWIDGVDFVMRFERLQEDFDEALRRAGVEKRLVIPVRNVTPGRERDYRDYYSERARRIVERWHRRELKEFGYSF